MGGRNSCQGKRCREEPYGICDCKSIMLCTSCFEIHKQENPKFVHKFIPMKEPVRGIEEEEKPITWDSLILLKRIYRSPEGSTEVHESIIKNRPGKYAVKVMYCRAKDDLNKKQKESDLQMKLQHPNICVCKAAFLDESYEAGYKFVIVMEFSENGDLEEEIDKRKLRKTPWTESELLEHMTQLIDAFAYLQESNLTHGDIKPRNLYLASDGHIKIGDFGESKQTMQALVTRTYQVSGTVIYFSPLLFGAYLDIIKGKNLSGDVRHNPIKSDVYSLGLSFLHMSSLSKPVELNNLDMGEDVLQSKVDKSISKLPYGEPIKNLLTFMLQVKEIQRYDFKQLKSYLNPGFNKEIQHKNSIRPSRSQSFSRSLGFKLISISQTQGKAYLYDTNTKIITLNNNRFQSSSRAFILKDSAIITGGLKSSSSVYKINLITSYAVKISDMCEGRSWHSIVLHNNFLFAIGGRSEQKETLSSTECLNILTNDIVSEQWQPSASLVHSRENATSTSLNDSIYIIGGSCKLDNRLLILTSIEKYTNDAWTELNVQLHKPTYGIGILTLTTKNLLFAGGIREKGAHTNEVYEFNVESETIEAKTNSKLCEADYFGSHSVFGFESKVFIMGSLIGCHILNESNKEWELKRYHPSNH